MMQTSTVDHKRCAYVATIEIQLDSRYPDGVASIGAQVIACQRGIAKSPWRDAGLDEPLLIARAAGMVVVAAGNQGITPSRRRLEAGGG